VYAELAEVRELLAGAMAIRRSTTRSQSLAVVGRRSTQGRLQTTSWQKHGAGWRMNGLRRSTFHDLGGPA
jgi:hypothetical protein